MYELKFANSADSSFVDEIKGIMNDFEKELDQVCLLQEPKTSDPAPSSKRKQGVLPGGRKQKKR